jgi:hypothetical protein
VTPRIAPGSARWKRAHDNGLWVRFYTLNGHGRRRSGWGDSYSFDAGRARPLARGDRGAGGLRRDGSVRGVRELPGHKAPAYRP